MKKTQVVVIGAGPSGLLLARLLATAGIQSLVLERRSRAYVESRIRAGVLEQSSVDLLHEAGVGARLQRQGLPHDGFRLVFSGTMHRIDVYALTGKRITVYGQTEIQKDLGEAHLGDGGQVLYEVERIDIHNQPGSAARIGYVHHGVRSEIECDFVAGCDGFHGVTRRSIPHGFSTHYERVYPFSWLGVMVDEPPVSDEILYTNHERGFAMCSLRSPTRSRYYLQCAAADAVDAWPDPRFWNELRSRLPQQLAAALHSGRSIEKSIVPLRSFVTEPMRFGRLFLVGDAAHVVPPTGAKGLNLAMADVKLLYRALALFYRQHDSSGLDGYSASALERVWNATRFSWWFTALLHRFSDDAFSQRMQIAELEHVLRSEAASRSIAESYAGLLH